MEGFYKKKGGMRELLAKEKKELFLGQDIFLGVGGNSKGFIMQTDSPSSWVWRGPKW